MRQGKTLSELAKEIERQNQSKKDYLADTRSLAINETGKTIGLKSNGDLRVNDLCHSQIATHIGIPQRYYDRMRAEAPELLARNVNHWFVQKPTKRLIRSLDGQARAFLSNKYRPLDNLDLAEIVLPEIQTMECEIQSCELTERRMYIKAVTKRIQIEVKKGDVVQAGIVISNSEVGCGSVRVEPLIFRLVCLNGMIAPDHKLKKYHVGRGFGDVAGAEATELYQDETRQADDRAFWLKVRDIVRASMDQVKFEKIVDSLREATERKIEGDPVKVVDNFAKRFTFAETDRTSVLKHLIEGGDLSQYGISNAVTRMSQDVEDYDKATDYERLGGEIIALPQGEWKQLACLN